MKTGLGAAFSLSIVLFLSACQASHALEKARPWRHLVQKYANAADVRRPASRRLTQPGGVLRGLEFVMSGYDIYHGNPSPTLAAVDPGFRKTIFAAEFNNGVTTIDGRFELPDGTTILSCEGSCGLASKVQSINGIESYRDSLASRVALGVELFTIASFGASFDYQRVEEGSTNRSQVFTQVESTCCVYRSFVSTFRPPPATSNFVAAVEFAPVEYDEQAYFEIIAEFGTHSVTSAEMGGLYGQETTFTREEFQRLSSSAFEWTAAAEASFLETISISADGGTSLLKNETRIFQSLSTTQRIYSLGARPPRSGSAEEWLQMSVENPQPTAIVLRPLSNLFSRRVVGDLIPDLEAKRANMDRAVVEYCTQFLKPGGKIRSCEAPTGDPPLPGPDRVCLAPVWAGGGPGGLPFDDNSDVLRVNGLNTGLEVRQISYMAKRYVDNLQFLITDRERRFPLGENGGKLGDRGRFVFPEGQKITSVQVKWDRYVNRISFYTTDGSVHSIGGSGGSHMKTINFRHAVSEICGYVPDKAWAVGTFGRAQNYVDAIGFHVAYTCRNHTQEVTPFAGV